MQSFIEKKSDGYYIPNPSLPTENFADKWNKDPEKARAFYEWNSAALQSLVSLPLSISDNYSSLEATLGETIVGRAISSVETRIDSSSAALAPYKEHTIQIALSVAHREKPSYRLPKRPTLAIAAVYKKDGTEFQYSNNGAPIPKGCSLEFRVIGARTALQGGYTIEWQVVNTGGEAEAATDLRGGFYKCVNNSKWHETTRYSGIHYVQAFLLKRGACIAKSREFIVNIA